MTIRELRFQLHDELLHDLRMMSCVSGSKATTASRRLRNSGVNTRLIASSSSSCFSAAETDASSLGVGGAGVGGHDQDHVAEIDLLAVVVGQLTVVHHLQQDVEQVRMRLLDLVEQEHACGCWSIPSVSSRPGRSPRSRGARRSGGSPVALHVLRHVEAQHLDAEGGGELLGGLGLADAGRAGEQVRADRLVRIAQAGPRQLDRRGQGSMALSCP